MGRETITLRACARVTDLILHNDCVLRIKEVGSCNAANHEDEAAKLTSASNEGQGLAGRLTKLGRDVAVHIAIATKVDMGSGVQRQAHHALSRGVGNGRVDGIERSAISSARLQKKRESKKKKRRWGRRNGSRRAYKNAHCAFGRVLRSKDRIGEGTRKIRLLVELAIVVHEIGSNVARLNLAAASVSGGCGGGGAEKCKGRFF